VSDQLLHAFTSAAHGASPVDLLVILFGLSLVPLLAVSVTSFTRIVVVLGLLRASLGTQSLPPNSVLIALAMLLSGVIMMPTLERIQTGALTPYFAHRISSGQALQRGAGELRRFMLRQARSSDVAGFERATEARSKERATSFMEASRDAPSRSAGVRDATFSVVTAAFMVGELRAAFGMGFAFALPFAVIDIVVAAVMISLGMFMVSPSSIALPIKLLLFVIADGWSIVCGALIASFR